MGIVCIRSRTPVIGVRHRGLMPTSTASGIPMSTTNRTDTPVTSSRSIESVQKPSSPKETKVPAISRAIRQLATTSPNQVAIAVTPSQPIWGTGRGKSGMETIRCNQSKAARNPSAMVVVSWMSGVGVAPGENRVAETGEAVVQVGVFPTRAARACSSHASGTTARSTPARRRAPGPSVVPAAPASPAVGGSWAPDAEGAGAIVAVTGASPLDRPSPLRRRPSESRRRRRSRRASRRRPPAPGARRPGRPGLPPG